MPVFDIPVSYEKWVVFESITSKVPSNSSNPASAPVITTLSPATTPWPFAKLTDAIEPILTIASLPSVIVLETSNPIS